MPRHKTPTLALLTVLLAAASPDRLPAEPVEAPPLLDPTAVQSGFRVRFRTSDSELRTGRVFSVDHGMLRVTIGGGREVEDVPWAAIEHLEVARGRTGSKRRTVAFAAIGAGAGAGYVASQVAMAWLFSKIPMYRGDGPHTPSSNKPRLGKLFAGAAVIGGAVGAFCGDLTTPENWRGVALGPNVNATVTGEDDGVRGALSFRF